MQCMSRTKATVPVTGGFLAARRARTTTAGAALWLARTDRGGHSRRAGYRPDARGQR